MIGIVILTLLAFLISILLVNLNEILDNDEIIEKMLPGYNCGACGYKGCADLADSISDDPELYKRCKILKGENLAKMEKYIKDNYNI